MRMRCKILIAVVLTAFPMQRAAAQTPAGEIIPGAAMVRGELLPTGTTIYHLVQVRAGVERQVATITDLLHPTEFDGVPAYLRVISVESADSKMVDSTYTRLSDLAPLSHRSYQPMRRLQLRFEGATVRGVIRPTGSPELVIDTAYTHTFYDSGNLDLVLAALAPEVLDDLPAGARLSIYDPDNGGQGWYLIRSEGEEHNGDGGAVQRVVVDLGARRATYWLEMQTRKLLRMEVELAPGVLLRQLRAAAPAPAMPE